MTSDANKVSFPLEPSRRPVKVRILADTVCDSHGQVSAGDELEVEHREFLQLQICGKAELVPVEAPAEGSADGDAGVTEEQFREELEAKTKAELVEIGKNYGLGLAQSEVKAVLIEAITKAALDANS